MTKKHFVAIAKAIRTMDFITQRERYLVADALSEYFLSINPLFDRIKFQNAVKK